MNIFKKLFNFFKTIFSSKKEESQILKKPKVIIKNFLDMFAPKEEKKQEDRVFGQNRNARRAEKSMLKHLIFQSKLRRIKSNLEDGRKAKRNALLKRIEKTKEKSEARKNFRKKIGSLHGVNYKRVALLSGPQSSGEYFFKIV